LVRTAFDAEYYAVGVRFLLINAGHHRTPLGRVIGFRLRCVFAILMLAASGVVSPGQTNSAVAPITTALGNHEFDQALELLRPALQASPANAQLWMLQGLAYSGKGDRESALHSYQAALRISPDYIAALKGAAQLEYQAGQADAVPLLEHILRLLPQDTTSHAMLADMAYKTGDCAKAVSHFSASRPILSSQPGALQEYGACLLKRKQTDEAILVFTELLRTQGDDPRARRALAAVQLSAGQPQNALATLQPDGRLLLRVQGQGELWATYIKPEKFIPDHGHLMHLFLIRLPYMDRMYHLHPERIEGGSFLENLPTFLAGKYQIFADIVDDNGVQGHVSGVLDRKAEVQRDTSRGET